MTVDVQECTNALKDRMPEKGHPEHKKAGILYLGFFIITLILSKLTLFVIT